MRIKLLPIKVYVIAFFAMLGLAAAFYIVLGGEAKSLVTTRLLNRQAILARAEAGNIASYFEAFGSSVVLRAQAPGIEQGGEETNGALDEFVQEWGPSGLVRGIALSDKNGVVRFNSNTTGIRDIGADISDRDYFVWAKKHDDEGDYFIGNPIISRVGATKGETIIPVASPVFQNGKFSGVLFTSFLLHHLAERFTEVMKISDTTSVYLAKSDGTLLHTNSASEEMGSNIFNLFPEVKNSLAATDEGRMKTKTYLIGYSTVSLGDQKWPLIIASPVQEVGNYTIPVYIRLTVLLLLVIATTILLGAVTVKEVRSQKTQDLS